MIGPTNRQSNLFYVPLARQAALLKDDLLVQSTHCSMTQNSWDWSVRGWPDVAFFPHAGGGPASRLTVCFDAA